MLIPVKNDINYLRCTLPPIQHLARQLEEKVDEDVYNEFQAEFEQLNLPDSEGVGAILSESAKRYIEEVGWENARNDVFTYIENLSSCFQEWTNGAKRVNDQYPERL